VETGKIKAGNGYDNKELKRTTDGFTRLGVSELEDWKTPLGGTIYLCLDWQAPERYHGLNKPSSYALMLKDSMTVRSLFESVVANEKLVKEQGKPNNGYGPNSCGFWDGEYVVEIDQDANPQTSTTGDNHEGPAEIWIDDTLTSHISNLQGSKPEVLSRHKFNCNKESCLYRWYWIVFRADQKNDGNGPAFQMWVQCAMIAGNNKDPIEVKPTGIWLADTRENKDQRAKNKIGLPISANPSEREVDGKMVTGNISSNASTNNFEDEIPASCTDGNQSFVDLPISPSNNIEEIETSDQNPSEGSTSIPPGSYFRHL
jgi:hypothetical protein